MKNKTYKKIGKKISIVGFYFFIVLSGWGQTTYFSQGSIDPTVTSNWNSSRTGGGTSPANFTSGDIFVIQNGNSMTTGATWTISGTGSKLWIENGGILTATSTITLSSGTTFQIDDGGTYKHQNTTAYGTSILQGTESFAVSSNFEINNSNATGPSGGTVFGNLIINFITDPGNVNMNGAITTINGNLYIQNTSSRELRISTNTSITLSIGGDLIITGGTLNFSNGSTAGKSFTLNIAGNYNQTGGTFTHTNSTEGNELKINFTGNDKTFTQSAGILTNTNMNWEIISEAAYTFNSNYSVPVSRSLTVNGTIDCGTSIISGLGNFFLFSGATLKTANADGINGTITVSGTKDFDEGANYIFYANGAQSTGISLPSSINNLTLSGASKLAISNSTLSCSVITINNGTTLTVNAGKALTARNNTINNGTLSIESNESGIGSFIDNGTITGSGIYNMERYVSSNGDYHWEYISSPIPSASSDLFTSSSPTIRNLYYSNESTNSWSNYSTTSTGNLEVMRGYARKYVNGETGSDDVITFTGTSLNTGSLSISNLTGTTISSVFNGWNLVGNPYPSAIDWDASSGWSKSDFYNSYYVRTNGTYSSYAYDLGTHDATRYIPPMQAFWVRALSEGTFTLTCNNDVRVHSNQNIYKPASTDNTLHLSITNNTNGFDDDTYIRFKPEATENFDSQYDAYKMFADDINYPQIYTHADNDDYSINNLSNINGERNIPIGFKISVSGQFTITADLVSSFTDNGNTVFLEDTQENILQDLSVKNSYTFNSDATSGLSRFIIHFNPSITNITENTDEKVCIYSYQNEIHVKATEMLDGEISIYNMLGQIVSIKKLSGNNSAVISLDKECAVYTVKYTSDKKSITRRIIINR